MDQTPKRPDRPSVEVDRTVGGAVNQRRFDEPKRSQTLTGMPAVKPGSGEYSPTLPVPAPRPTIRRDTPPAVLEAIRRGDGTQRVPPEATAAPNERQGAENDDAPQSLPEAQTALLRDELAKSRQRIAELERDARAAAEAKVATFPPSVQPQRKPSPPPDSGAKRDQAIGAAVRTLAVRVAAKLGWTPLLVALGVGGGVTAIAKPAADPAKTDAVLANTEAIKRELELTRRQLNGLLDREAARDAYLACLAEQQAEYFAQLTPAADKMGAAAPLKPFVDRCKNRKP